MPCYLVKLGVARGVETVGPLTESREDSAVTDSIETREFHIGDIISITSERLVSPRLMDGVCDILGWMTGDQLWTHQIPRAADECAPALRAQFPDLGAVEVPEGLNSEAAVLAWLADQESAYGATRFVRKLADADHTSIDPIAEMRMMRPDAQIVPVELPGEWS